MNTENKIICGIDTETTGFPKNGERVQEGQARVCQVAMILVDQDKNILTKFSTLVKPDDWVISEGAQKVHGITMEQCEKYGMDFRTIVGFYKFMAGKADFFVAHNAEFDQKMMDIEVAYYNKVSGNNNLEIPNPYICTMKPNTDVVKAPKKSGYGYKWPTLEEALQFFCNRSMGDTAHDALADTEACLDIFFAAQEYNNENNS